MAKNIALSQNVWGLFVSIQNTIPVIIIGDPGSSKTTSANLLTQQFKG